MEKTGCGVKHHIFTPLDIEKYPFFLYHSQGTHSHIYPPPSKKPTQIIRGLTDLVQELHEPGLTSSRYTPYTPRVPTRY